MPVSHRDRLATGGILLAAAAAVLVYRGAAAALYRPGFPLDDAWIHQTYARHLAQGQGWVYRPPEQGRGAVTAPLWVLLLAAGHKLGISPQTWVGLLGWLSLAALARLAADWPGLRGYWRGIAAAGMLAAWHLVWAALSGMETLALALVLTWGLAELARPRPRWRRVALATALALWLRPEGVGLAGLALLRAFAWRHDRGPRGAGQGALWVLAAALTSVAAYALFHRHLTGAWWPTTGPAKMAEYAPLRAIPFWRRWLRLWTPLLAGPGSVALVGWLAAWFRPRAWRARPGPWLLSALPAGLVTLYAWRLPVTYQHGRYLIPALPSLLLAGLSGWQALFAPARPTAGWRRAALALGAGAAGLSIGFWLLGARAYAWDVAFIESEMVDTARWVAEHVPAEAVVAAHDIGALGYFAPQPLADLAGLLDPTVIPYLRDEVALARYLQRQRAAYLVTFPGWYRDLDRCSRPLFRSQGAFAPALGGENMIVYAWQPCPGVLAGHDASGDQ